MWSESTKQKESPAGKDSRTSRSARLARAFFAGMVLGLLPLALYVLNHVAISLSLSFHLGLTFCYPQTHLPAANIGRLDTAAFILFVVEAVLGVPVCIVIGKAFHWRRSTIAVCASGLLFALAASFIFDYAVFFWIAFRQCFHLVG